MKHKFSSMGRVAIALVLALSLSLVMAVPVAATHTSSAAVAFAGSTVAGEGSILDVEVTNSMASAGDINKVKIDFTESDFVVDGAGVVPANWASPGPVDDVVTYTADAGFEIAPDASVTFSPAVTNPEDPGAAVVPAVLTTDIGSAASVTATVDSGWIGYIADSAGIGSNDITVEYVDPGMVGQGLSVSVLVKAITVSLETDGEGACVSTATQVETAIDAGDADALVDATADGEHLDYVVQPLTVPAFTGGTSPDVDKACTVTPGTLAVTPGFMVTATPTDDRSAADTSYETSFTTLQGIDATTGTIVIDFTADYDLTAVVVAEDFSMTDDGAPYTPALVVVDTITNNDVTITADAAIAVGSDVVITIANDHIRNPAASGGYVITVTGKGTDIDTDTVTIVPASFLVEPAAVTAGTAFTVTVTAKNVADADDTGYTGGRFIDFSSEGTGQIPAFEYLTFVAGTDTSLSNFILTNTDETPTITASEGSLTGTSAEITIVPGAFDSFTMAGVPTTVVASVAFANNVTVTAYDACGNVKTDYTGTVAWSGGGAGASLPAGYTFDGGDAGVHDFAAGDFILVTVGAEPQTITVTDGVVSETSGDIVVVAAAMASLDVVPLPTSIVANGLETSTITASALDADLNVDTSYTTAITFETNLGVFVESGSNEYTASPSDGVATANLKSTEIGTATVKVTSGTLDPVTVTVTLVEAVVVADLEISVVKTGVPGDRTYNLFGTYVDADGETVTGADGVNYTVTFSTSPTDEVTLTPPDGINNPIAGVATVALATTLVPGETITVTATGIGLSDSAVITVGVETYDISLVAGWNLISLPLIPTNSDIAMVLAGVDVTINKVAYYTGGPDGDWLNYIPSEPGASDLTTMDDGRGYWIDVSVVDILVVAGTELALPGGTQPSYDLHEGWNLIGFKSLDVIKANIYLDELGGDEGVVQAMYSYDVSAGIYVVVQAGDAAPDDLEPGLGYWLALSDGGTIYP